MAQTQPAADAAKTAGSEPKRRCIVTRASFPRRGLIRFVLDPSGRVVPDLAETLPGRGMWVTADRAILDTAVTKNTFAKAARRSVELDPQLPDRLVDLLERRVLEALALARRAGMAVSGFEKVRTLVRDGQAGVLLIASDAGADGAKQLSMLIAATGDALPVDRTLTAAAIGKPFGRSQAVYCAVGHGPLADRVVVDLKKLGGFSGQSGNTRTESATPS